MVGGVERHILLTRFRRRTVRCAVDAEQGKIARVAGPDPIVRVAPEFANGTRGSADQPHVLERPGNDEKLLIAVKEVAHHGLVVRSLGGGRGQPLTHGLLGFRTFRTGRLHRIGHVLDAHDEHGRQARIHELLLHRHGPEPILQNVPFQAAVRLDLPVTAVVVRQEQALVGDHTRRTTATELDDGVFERTPVDRIDVLRRQLEAHGLHVAFNGLEQGGNPHAFRGARGQAV